MQYVVKKSGKVIRLLHLTRFYTFPCLHTACISSIKSDFRTLGTHIFFTTYESLSTLFHLWKNNFLLYFYLVNVSHSSDLVQILLFFNIPAVKITFFSLSFLLVSNQCFYSYLSSLYSICIHYQYPQISTKL